MKRRKIFAILVSACAILVAVFLWLSILQARSEQARDVEINDTCQRIFLETKWFMQDQGRLPHSLTELHLDSKIDAPLIQTLQHSELHDTYEYIQTTNGFTIIITGPSVKWFEKGFRMEKHYTTNDLLNVDSSIKITPSTEPH
jgi:hypothetical protein